MKFYDEDIKDVLKYLEVSEDGLKDNDVQDRLIKYGKNEIPKAKSTSILKIFLAQFINPMEFILIATVILSFVVGENIDAIALIFIILVDVLMGTYEEWKAKKDAESLSLMIKSMSRVIRDGKEVEIDSSMVVLGDIMVLESGTRISADGRIIECHNFQVDESPLTGESLNVLKNKDVLKGEFSLADRSNMVYAGTTVVTGRALVVVTSTGIKTEIGKIADKVANTEEEKSPLTIRTEKFSRQIMALIIIIAIITGCILAYKGYEVHEIFICVIALAVSAMPEGLPLALTMALTIASKRMAKKNVIVKKLNSVESLGSCTVIASDKTGTLTVNEQTARRIVLEDGSSFSVTGTGYNDDGEVIPSSGADISKAKELVLLGAINNEAHLEKVNEEWVAFGDSIDIAFLCLAKKIKLGRMPKVIESIPYESENQYSAVYYEEDGKLYCTVKGSLEKVMSFSCKDDKYIEENVKLTKEGFRVIALASGVVSSTEVKDLKNLDFKGMVAFIDPIRDEVKDSIKECKMAGIKVIMITGDHPLTAYAIAKELGLCESSEEVATGDLVAKYREMGEEKFDSFVKGIKVFSRVTPMDKLDIVNSLKRQGEFIAVTGDGVNDAPALKVANIGIAMGSGTDVAKETASMIVIDDNFTSIVAGIKEGRTAYSNIRKITLFLLSCGLAEVLFFLLSIAFGFDIPLLAIQLLWLNIVTDGLQDVALSFEKGESSIMKEKPRDTKESLFSKDLAIEVAILGLSITLIIFGTWKYLMDHKVDITVSRAIIMMLMVFIQNINVLNCRSEKKSIFKKSLFTNPILILTLIGSILLEIVMSEFEITALFLGVVPLEFLTILKLLLLSCVIIVIFEIYKFIYRRKKVK